MITCKTCQKQFKKHEFTISAYINKQRVYFCGFKCSCEFDESVSTVVGDNVSIDGRFKTGKALYGCLDLLSCYLKGRTKEEILRMVME